MNDNVTIIIKTFNRYKSIKNLLQSISSNYPNTKVIVLDDGLFRKINLYRLSRLKLTLDLTYIESDFDIGLSKGRNILYKAVETEFLLLCDDDFVLPSNLPISNVIHYLNSGFDFISGPVIDFFKVNSLYSLFLLFKPRNFKSWLYRLPMNEESINVPVTNDEPMKVLSINNFFITRKCTLTNLGGWQPEELKIYEHGTFKKRLRQGNYSLGYMNSFVTNSHRYMPMIYLPFRLRSKRKYSLIASKYFQELTNN